jgi:hypothetical protein
LFLVKKSELISFSGTTLSYLLILNIKIMRTLILILLSINCYSQTFINHDTRPRIVLDTLHYDSATIKELLSNYKESTTDSLVKIIIGSGNGWIVNREWKTVTDTIKVDYIAGIREDGLIEVFGAKYLVHKYKKQVYVLYGEQTDNEWTIVGAYESVLKNIHGIAWYMMKDRTVFVNYTLNKEYWKQDKITNKKL